MSNIAVVYGYGLQNLDIDAWDTLGNLHNFKGISVLASYSDSEYDPDTAVIGIRVMNDINLFYPEELENNLTEEQKEIVDSFEIPECLREYIINEKPKFMVFGYSDD